VSPFPQSIRIRRRNQKTYVFPALNNVACIEVFAVRISHANNCLGSTHFVSVPSSYTVIIAGKLPNRTGWSPRKVDACRFKSPSEKMLAQSVNNRILHRPQNGKVTTARGAALCAAVICRLESKKRVRTVELGRERFTSDNWNTDQSLPRDGNGYPYDNAP